MSEPVEYPRLGVPQAALILLFTPDRQVLAVNEKGKGVGFPGGKVEGRESARDCALRELFEETNCRFGGSLRAAPIQIVEGTVVHAFWGSYLDAFSPFHGSYPGQQPKLSADAFLTSPARLVSVFTVVEDDVRRPIRYPLYNKWLLEHVAQAAGITWR